MNTDNLKTQLEETINKFYERRGISEIANIEIESSGNGSIVVKIFTQKLLEMEIFMNINQIVFLLAPLDLLYETENHTMNENECQKILWDDEELKFSIH